MEIDWILIVLIGILACLVYIAVLLGHLQEANRINMNTLYKQTAAIDETIKDQIYGVKTVMRELG